MKCETVPERARVSCDGCNEVIETPTDGVVVVGSVYAAEVAVIRDGGVTEFRPTGGLVGGSDNDDTSAWHWSCFLRALGWGRLVHATVDEEEADGIMAEVFGVERDVEIVEPLA